ncbi:MAG: hypothetical protein LBQ43_04325 [Holosporales bacterium]|jgi:hypothetical protein|nr:hypothetical protein [Holosporales bacterium]
MCKEVKITRWSHDEIEFIKKGFLSGLSVKVLARKLGRTPSALNKALSRFNIRQRADDHRPESDDDDCPSYACDDPSYSRYDHSSPYDDTSHVCDRNLHDDHSYGHSSYSYYDPSSPGSPNPLREGPLYASYDAHPCDCPCNCHMHNSGNDDRIDCDNNYPPHAHPPDLSTRDDLNANATQVRTSIGWVIKFLTGQGYSVSRRPFQVGRHGCFEYFMNHRPVTLARLLIIANSIRLEQRSPIFVLDEFLLYEQNGNDRRKAKR